MPVRAVDDKSSDTLVVVSGEGFWTGSSTLPHLHQRRLTYMSLDRLVGARSMVESTASGGKRYGAAGVDVVVTGSFVGSRPTRTIPVIRA